MKKTKKLFALLLIMAISVSFLAGIPLSANATTIPGNQNTYDVVNTAQFAAALLRAKDRVRDEYGYEILVDNEPIFPGGQIYLARSFEHFGGISIDRFGGNLVDKKVLEGNVTINLSGNNLTLTNPRGTGIYLRNGAVLTINGPGTVTIRATQTGIDIEGDKEGSGSHLRLTGDARLHVTSIEGFNESRGVDVRYNSTAQVSSIAVSGINSSGALVNNDSSLSVSESITASGIGAVAVEQRGNRVTVGGSVTASGYDSIAVRAAGNGRVLVEGNVAAYSNGSIGARAEASGRIYVVGDISGDGTAIRLGSTNVRADRPERTGVVLTERDHPITNSAQRRLTWSEYYVSNSSARVYKAGGDSVSDGWRQIGRDWFYFKGSDPVTEEWFLDGGEWYYLRRDGSMANNQFLTLDSRNRVASRGTTYYFHPNGKMATGWVQIRNAWYYLKPGGARATNEWQQISGVWYWFKSTGVMAANETVRIGNVRHSFTSSGAWIDPAGGGSSGAGSTAGNWLREGSTWYFIKPGNIRASNEWVLDGGTWYWLKAGGAMAANERITIGGKAYNFNSSGACTNPY